MHNVAVVRTQPAPLTAQPVSLVSLETGILLIGSLGSAGIILLSILEYAGLVHTRVSALIVYLFVYGEDNMPGASGEFFHGEWGDRMFSIMAAPVLLAFSIATIMQYVRRR